MPETQQVLKWAMTAPVMEFDIPIGSKVIDVRTQDNVPCLWTLGPMASGGLRRTFVAFGTGHPISDSKPLQYVGSAHGIDGWMVFHIFERES